MIYTQNPDIDDQDQEVKSFWGFFEKKEIGEIVEGLMKLVIWVCVKLGEFED